MPSATEAKEEATVEVKDEKNGEVIGEKWQVQMRPVGRPCFAGWKQLSCTPGQVRMACRRGEQ